MIIPKIREEIKISSPEKDIYIINNPENNAYIELDDEKYFIFSQIDGKIDSNQIAAGFLLKYEKLGHELIAHLLTDLESGDFLISKMNIDIKEIKHESAQLLKFRKLLNYFTKITCEKSFPKILGIINKIPLKCLYKPYSYVVLFIIGLVGFSFLLKGIDKNSLHFFSIGKSYPMGFLVFVLVAFCSINLYFFSQILFLQAYKRKIINPHIKFFFLLPFFASFGKDIIMEKRYVRIMYHLSGAYLLTIIGGLFSIFLFVNQLTSCFYPSSNVILNDIIFKFVYTPFLVILFFYFPGFNSDANRILKQVYKIKGDLKSIFEDAFGFINIKRFFKKASDSENYILSLLAAFLLWLTIVIKFSSYIMNKEAVIAFKDLITASTILNQAVLFIILVFILFPILFVFAISFYYVYSIFLFQAVRRVFWETIFILHLLVFYFIIPAQFHIYLNASFLIFTFIWLFVKEARNGLQFLRMGTSGREFLLITFLFYLLTSSFYYKHQIDKDFIMFFDSYLQFLLLVIIPISFYMILSTLNGKIRNFWFRYLLSIIFICVFLINPGFSFAIWISAILIFLAFYKSYYLFGNLDDFVRNIDVTLSTEKHEEIFNEVRTIEVFFSRLKIASEHIFSKRLVNPLTKILKGKYRSRDDLYNEILTFYVKRIGCINLEFLFLRVAEEFSEVERIYIQNYFNQVSYSKTNTLVISEFNSIDSIKNNLLEIPLFKILNSDEVSIVIKYLKREKYKKSSYIIRQGAIGDKFYIIRSGSVKVVSTDDFGLIYKLAVLKESDCFGEIALIEEKPRTASVISNEDAELYTLSKKSFLNYIVSHEDLGIRITDLIRSSQILSKAKLFEKLNSSQIFTLASNSKIKEVKEDDIIVHEGEDGNEFYFIVEGEFSVSKKEDTEEKNITTLKPGEYFGELALIMSEPRNATVKATGFGKVISIDKSGFLEVFQNNETVKAIFQIAKRV
ncbi:MAG: cyclic nucleotide-binding domain-containing protein [Pseudomonadota bacterium]